MNIDTKASILMGLLSGYFSFFLSFFLLHDVAFAGFTICFSLSRSALSWLDGRDC
jgi:hypothetical protein